MQCFKVSIHFGWADIIMTEACIAIPEVLETAETRGDLAINKLKHFVGPYIYLLLRLVVSVRVCVFVCSCVRTCEKRKRKPHARAPG